MADSTAAASETCSPSTNPEDIEMSGSELVNAQLEEIQEWISELKISVQRSQADIKQLQDTIRTLQQQMPSSEVAKEIHTLASDIYKLRNKMRVLDNKLADEVIRRQIHDSSASSNQDRLATLVKTVQAALQQYLTTRGS